MKLWKETHPEYFQRKAKENYSRARVQRTLLDNVTKAHCLTHYGEGKLACVRCGFSDIRALSLDHIEGGGSKIRAMQKKNHQRVLTGKALYRYLYLRDYPIGYQTLCMNCQFIKRYENMENK